MTSAERNAATIRRALEAINARQLEDLAELVAPGFVRHDYGGTFIERRGPEGMAEMARLLLGALPDLTVSVHDVFATHDRAVVYASLAGTHRGEFLGAPPSGEGVCLDTVDLYRLEGAKIAEVWPWPDLAGLRRWMDWPAGCEPTGGEDQ
jgi:predicted ester cyclase